MGEREREEGGVGCVGPSQATEVFVCESADVALDFLEYFVEIFLFISFSQIKAETAGSQGCAAA